MDPTMAALSSASNMQSNMFNALNDQVTNLQQQRWSEKMYDKQYKNTLEFWGMQNDYNSPQNQMKRFQEANLNPNLIYGRGESGNAGPIQTPDIQPVNFKSPRFERSGIDYLGVLNGIADLDIKRAQVDNIKAQNTVIVQDALLKAAMVGNTDIRTERDRFALDLDTELRGTSAEYRREQLRQLRTSTDLGINRDAREALTTSSNLKEAAERMLNSQQQRAQSRAEVNRIQSSIKNLETDNRLKLLDEGLRKSGINPSDPTWLRVTGRALTDMYDGGVGDVLKNVFEWLNN